MKKATRIGLSVLLTVLLGFSPASAEFYVAGYAGVAIPLDKDVDVNAIGVTPLLTLQDVNLDTSVAYGGKVGYFFESLLGLATGNSAWAQSTSVELLLAGNEYHQTDLPANPAGTWWVLHRPAGETVLEALQVVVTPFQTCGDDQPEEQSGRAVSVPAARDPILLVRRHPAPRAGTVRTAFLDEDGAGEDERVEAPWGDRAVIVRHVAEEPTGDQPGEYRIELTVGDRQFELHADQWHGDGHWRVRWIGDLNRDGWPDLLVDASSKYSVYTTRLYLSLETDGRLEVSEAATFTHFAC